MPNYADWQSVTALPAADAAYHGRTLLLTAAGQHDRAYICRQQSGGTYYWYPVMETNEWVQTGSSGAPDDAAYLVAAAHGGLSAEIVVGATPGGELGGTWPAPTVDAVHSGSAHHVPFVQSDHDALANPHHSNANDHAPTNDPTAGQKAALAGTSGTPGDANRYVTDGDARNTNARTPVAHGDAEHNALSYAATGHAHGGVYEPAGAVATHEADATAVHGIADTASLVLTNDARLSDARTPTAHATSHTTGADKIATGTPDGTKFLRDDFAWAAPTAAHPDLATHDTLGLATQAELDTHAGAADPHAGYRLESADLANADLAQVTAPVFKGRTTAGLGDLEDLTPTQATALLNAFTSALKGLVPASGGGTTNFLRADGTFAAPPGGGGGMNLLKKTADQTINAGAGVFTDIADLTFPVVNGTDYAFHFYIAFRSAATTTGWRAGVNCPAGTLDFWAQSDVIANGAAGVATHTERHNTVRDDMTLLTATITQAVDLAVRIEGRYKCTASGTFAARFANELAANTQIVVQRGSWGWWF